MGRFKRHYNVEWNFLEPCFILLLLYFFSPGKLNTDAEIVKNQTTKTKRKREGEKNVSIDKVVQISTEGNRDF